ncbi:MAG: aminotransferase class I/II-fold pyridoxal phosphate-dependent enzyme [Coprococcus sp.]
MKEYINDTLTEYSRSGKYPWHMPGHKRQDCLKADIWNKMFDMDYTEAKDLDDMHSPKTFIKGSLTDISYVYGTYKTYMLVNGSTVGILAAIHACTRRGQSIMAARNCHKSVYNAIELQGLNPTYIMPDYIEGTDIFGDIKPDKIENILQQMDDGGELPAAVVITSPTYEGVISDIKNIADVVHRYNIPLIVDEAQGAHFEYVDRPEYKTAMEYGADIVIESLHKTMPALTQTSLLHVMNDKLTERIEKYLQIFETSSPSYIFMQSMEKAISYGDGHRKEFLKYIENVEKYRSRYKKLKNISIFSPDKDIYAYDIGKLVFVIKPGTYIEAGGRQMPLTGTLLGDILADSYNQVVEMTAADYVIAMTSVADNQEAYDTLYDSIKKIDDISYRVAYNNETVPENKMDKDLEGMAEMECRLHIPEFIYSANEAVDMDVESIPLDKAEKKVAATYIYAYPPGIPVLVPGERIDAGIIENITYMAEKRLNIEGIIIDDKAGISLNVIAE